MRLYTGTGDSGSTDLLGERVAKDDPRIDLIGTLDETTSAIGLGRVHAPDERVRAWLLESQRDLYKIMAELAFTDDLRPAGYTLDAARVEWLEQVTDQLSNEIELPPQFIIPGDSLAGATLDVARTVARRAERQAVHLAGQGIIHNPEVLRYLNRLSSLLFMAARSGDVAAGVIPTKAKNGRS